MSILENKKHSYNVFNDNGTLSVKTVKLNSAYQINVAYVNSLMKSLYNITTFDVNAIENITLNLGDIIGNNSTHDVMLVPYSIFKHVYPTTLYPELHYKIVDVLEQYVDSEARLINPIEVVNGKTYPTNVKERERVSVYKTAMIENDHGNYVNSVITQDGRKFIEVNYIAYLLVTTTGIIKQLIKQYGESQICGDEIIKQHSIININGMYYTKDLLYNALLENNGYNSVIAISSGIKRLESI